MCHYYITRSFARSFTFFIILKRTRSLTFFIPISHVRYIYAIYSYRCPNISILWDKQWSKGVTEKTSQFILNKNFIAAKLNNIISLLAPDEFNFIPKTNQSIKSNSSFQVHLSNHSFHARPSSSTHVHPLPRKSIHFHRRPSSSTHVHLLPRKSIHFHGRPSSSTQVHHLPWTSILFHTRPSSSRHVQLLPWTSILFHARPSSSTHVHPLPLTSILFHGRSFFPTSFFASHR